MSARNDETYYTHNQYQPFLREGKEITGWDQHESWQEMRRFMKRMAILLLTTLTALFVGLYLWG